MMQKTVEDVYTNLGYAILGSGVDREKVQHQAFAALPQSQKITLSRSRRCGVLGVYFDLYSRDRSHDAAHACIGVELLPFGASGGVLKHTYFYKVVQ
jgi:hypothetical protein